MARILIVDDEPHNALIVARCLGQAGHSTTIAPTAMEALEQLRGGSFEVLVTDWMMPEMDGLELIRRVRQEITHAPVIVMMTALDSPKAQAHALESGADEFLIKPVLARDAAEAVARGLGRQHGASLHASDPSPLAEVHGLPPVEAEFPLVAIGANAGGPAALRRLVRGLGGEAATAAFVVAQHLQPVMLEALIQVLQRETSLRVTLGRHAMKLEPGLIIVAPATHHVEIADGARAIALSLEPRESHVRPAADSLFRTAADTFGAACIAVVLTGMGRDGTAGAARVRARGGSVLVAAPGAHVAAAMPESVIHAGHASVVAPLEDLSECVRRAVAAAPVSGRAALAR